MRQGSNKRMVNDEEEEKGKMTGEEVAKEKNEEKRVRVSREEGRRMPGGEKGCWRRKGEEGKSESIKRRNECGGCSLRVDD